MITFAVMKWIFTVLFSLTVLSLSAQEQNYMLDEVIVTTNAKPAEATLQRTVIDTTIMQAFQNSTLGDLLSQNSPITIKSYGRGDLQSATFRGTAPSHTAVYWNGIRINSPMVGAVDFGQIPLFFVDKLSIDAGVSAMAVTSGALGGVVNIESQPQWDRRFAVEAVQSFGSFTTTDSYLNIVAGSHAFQSSTKLFYTYSKNDFEFINRDIIDPERPDYRPTQRNENGEYHRSGFMQEFFMRLDSVQTLSAIVWGLLGDSKLPQLTTYEGDQANNLTDKQDGSLRAAITYKKYGTKLDLTARLSADLQTMGFNQQNRTGAGYQQTIQSTGLSRSIGWAVDASLKLFERQTIGLNAAGLLDYVDSFERVKKVGFKQSRTELSIMAVLHSTWSKRFSTSVAVRGSVVGDKLFATPFAGVEYRISTPFSLKARVGYNVHCPSISDLYYVPGGNVELQSEKSLTFEIGAKYSSGNAKVELNIFSSWIDDWIVWLPSHQQYWTPQNIKKVLSQGFELTASNHWSWRDWGLYGNLNFTLNRTVNDGDPMVDGDESVGKQLVYVPLLSGGIYARANWRHLWVSYQLYGESERYTTTSNNQSVHGTIAPYTFSDIACGYSWRMLSLELKCRNLFDSQYYTVLRRPLPGRSFEAVLRFKI